MSYAEFLASKTRRNEPAGGVNLTMLGDVTAFGGP